jgi:hypothetical protein
MVANSETGDASKDNEPKKELGYLNVESTDI